MDKGNSVAVGSADSPVLNASNSSTDRAVVIGHRCLNITDEVDFKRTVYQQVTSSPNVPLPDGKYALSAMVKSGSGFEQLYVYAVSDNTIR